MTFPNFPWELNIGQTRISFKSESKTKNDTDLNNIGNSENLRKGEERGVRSGVEDHGGEGGAIVGRSLLNECIN